MTLIQPRRGTAAEWTSVNPVLATGELGYETDTGREKRGDGANLWSALGYLDTRTPPTVHLLDPNFTSTTVLRPKTNSGGTTNVLDTTIKRTGLYSMKVTAGNGTVDGFYMGGVSTTSITTTGFGIPCSEGQSFYVECWAYVPSAQNNSVGTTFLYASYRGAGVSNSSAIITSFTMSSVTKDTWTRMSGFITIPAGVEVFNPYIQVHTNVTAGDVVYFDNFFVKDANRTATATLNFGALAANSHADLTITVAGAQTGDCVALGIPTASVTAGVVYTAWVSATNTVTVRANNYTAGSPDPASGVFRATVIR